MTRAALTLALFLLTQQRITIRIVDADTSAFHLGGEASELSGTTNGSTVTPIRNLGPSGTLAIDGTGSINFAAMTVGTGVQFLNGGQQATDVARYRFTGTTLSNVWNVEQGHVTFYVKSSYSFAVRRGLGSGDKHRYVYDVYDDTQRQFVFYTTIFANVPDRLKFVWGNNAYGTEYDVPVGTEDTTFGDGVTMKVDMDWNGTNHGGGAAVQHLYINDVLVQTLPYTYSAPNWGSSSLMIIGAQGLLNGEGFFSLDDRLDDLIVRVQ